MTSGHLLALPAILAIGLAAPAMPAAAGQIGPRAPFVETLSNNAPLQFGLTADQTATALGAPLLYLTGRPGDETFVATVSGGHFFRRDDALFMQFRNGRLAGWKVDRRIAGGGPGGPW